MGSLRGREALVGAVLTAAVVAWAVWYSSRPAPGGGSGQPPPRSGTITAPTRSDTARALPGRPTGEAAAADVPVRAPELLGRLGAALSQGDPFAVRAAARGLRAGLLYADRATMEALRAALLDGSIDMKLRQALAIVLGSLSGEFAQALLADALTRCTGPPELVRSLLLALGELKEGPGAGDFGAEDVPHGVRDSSGLAVRVRGPLRADAVAAAVPRLADADVETRRVAALVLRDSVAQPAVRGALLGRLPVETDDEACGEVGAALVVTTVDAESSDPGRAEVVRALLDASRRPYFDITRFRLEAGLGSATLDPAEEAELAQFLRKEDARLQVFALEVLGRRLREGGTTAPAAEVAREMSRLLLAAPEHKVREIAARVMRPAAETEVAAWSLVRALETDDSWEVRATAAQSLGSALLEGKDLPPSAIDALRRAADADAREEVRAAARAALTTSGR